MLSDHPPFHPHPLLRSAHLMTVFGSQLGRRLRAFADEAQIAAVDVDRRTKIKVEAHWQADSQAPVLILIHGLGGTARRSYMLGTAHKAWQRGLSVVRMNMRNSDGTEDWTPTLYHAGLTEDLRATLRWIDAVRGAAPVVVGGFSLGGSVALNTLAELGACARPQVRGCVTVSTPLDLMESDRALHRPGLNRLYVRHFMNGFRRMWRRKHAAWPELYPADGLNGVRTVRDFDDRWTAPTFGWPDADAYYRAASAGQRLDAIRVPGLIVHADDDPFVPLPASLHDELLDHPYLRLLRSRHGGHVGYLARRPGPEAGGWQDADGWWAENRIVQFACAVTRD